MNSLCHRYLNQNILPFVGRETELKRLRALFREFLEEGESKYALIAGESGSGKSRLVVEFEQRLQEEFGETCVVVHARYLEGNAAALTPIVNGFTATLAHQEHLKHLLRGAGLLKSEHIELGLTNGTLSQEIEPPPLQVLLDSLSEIAKRFPLVLILEDVHNVEDLPLFDQFFLGLSSASKFVMLTERTGLAKHFHGHSSEHLMREIALREERASVVLPLSDFRREDVNRLFQILFVIEPTTPLLETVLGRTTGRPLSLRTMLRQLVTTGVLQYDHGKWSEDQEAALEGTPNSGEEEALARFQRELERLNEYEQIVATHGALLGEQFDLRLLRRLISHRLGENNLTEELFQRAIDLLTFKSIIRRATPSIVLNPDPTTGIPSDRENLSAFCYEFSHQHFWSTVLESAHTVVAGEHSLVLAIVELAGSEHLPLYSSAFFSITGTPFALSKNPAMTKTVEYFLLWAAAVVKSLWSQEPQQCLRLLMALRQIRDEITWRFGPDLSESSMGALLDLHSLLVEAFIRTSPLEAERDIEHSAVLEKFISASSRYSTSFKGTAKGRVATLRAILHHQRTSYPEFERWASEARDALAVVPDSDLERARLLSLLTRHKGEALLNMGKFMEADALIEQGMPTAQLLADHRFDEYSLYCKVAVNSKLKQDQNVQATELTQQIMTLAQQRGNTLVETTFLFQAALAAFSAGDLASAVRYCDLGILNGRRYGIRFVEIMSYLWRMIIAGVQQDPEKIKECSQQLAMLVEDARILAQSPNLLQRISIIEGRATAMNFLGRHHAALEFADDAIQLAERAQHDSFAAWAQNEKALALIGLGRYEEALAVARACVQLAGEQRMAERTARTALIMAYAGVGKFVEARREAETARAEYNERNPYYLRFALAEARLMRLSIGRAATIAERQALKARLAAIIAEILTLVESWNAPLLGEQIRKEFQDVAPKKVEPERRLALAGENGESPLLPLVEPKIRLWTFGTLTAEPITDGREREGTSDDPEKRDVRTREQRDNKVRQLITLLVAIRAESSEGRGGNRGSHSGAITRESLIDQLWADSDTGNVLNVLYSSIKRARAFLGSPDSIQLTEDGYSLAPIVSTDCEDVLRHYAESRQARKRSALFSVTFHHEQIISLTDRGPFLNGIYGPWLDSLRTRLTTLRRTAAIRLIQTDLERGLFDRVEDLCHKLLTLDEFDEEALRGLLLVSARRNQKATLVRLYDDFSKKLKLELSTDPSPELRTLYSSLVAGSEASVSQVN